MLHVLNGHSLCPLFEQSGLPGVAVVCADALHEGPVPAGLSAEALARVRRQFWTERAAEGAAAGTSATDDPPDDGAVAGWHAARARLDEHEEVVLWLEHDLFDQLLLIQHLDWFAARRPGRTRLSLICIDAHPGIERFFGLGQLEPTQLAALFETRAEVSPAQLAVGRLAWQAFTADDPRRVERLVGTDTHALPFLRRALSRWLQEFPAVGSGLPRTEHQVLNLLTGHSTSPRSLFGLVQAREDCFFMGDTSFRWRLNRLASPPRPLVGLELERGGVDVLPPGAVAITETGRDVVAGRVDWLGFAPFDRWLGGVHVTDAAMWRWNGELGRLEGGHAGPRAQAGRDSCEP